jgi:hypothetical protein
VAGGVLAFFDFGGLIPPLVQDPSTGAALRAPSFRAGPIPFISLGAGLNIPLPISTAIGIEGAIDLPLRLRQMPGGGGIAYYRLGLGLTLQP